jgi:hypothetical protein
MVPTAGLEPAQVAPLAPQTSASTNFATSASYGLWPNFSRGSPSEPRKLAALRAGKNNSLAAPITSEAALDSRVPAAVPARSLAAAWA